MRRRALPLLLAALTLAACERDPTAPGLSREPTRPTCQRVPITWTSAAGVVVMDSVTVCMRLTVPTP